MSLVDHDLDEVGESGLPDQIDVFDAIHEVESSELYADIQPVSFGLATDAIARAQARAPSEAVSIVRNGFRNGADWAVLAANFCKTR
jgi:hypothetical protein